MKRFNGFSLIHKGLRAMLYDASVILQQTDFADASQAKNALTTINNVLYIFGRHAHHEDTYIFPLVETHEPELAKSFEDEHAEDHRLSDQLKNLLTIYDYAELPEEKINCGSAIVKSLTDFLVFNLVHMGKEEIYINQALWKHYTDGQIIAANQQLVASIPPAELMANARWMLRAISNNDAIGWLKNIKQTAPAPVFNNLMQLAKEELSELRFAIIQEELEEPVLA